MSSTTLVQVSVELLNSYYTYQLVGTTSNAWKNLWTHSSFGVHVSFHIMTHWSMSTYGELLPRYPNHEIFVFFVNLSNIILLTWSHICRCVLCVPHHLVGVSFNAISKDWTLTSTRTCSSYYSINSSTSSIPSDFVGLDTLDPIH